MNFLDLLPASIRARLVGREQPIRFLVAGGLNTVFGLSLYPILLWSIPMLHREYELGLVIAQAISLVFAFTMYKLTVFRTRAGILGEFGRFVPFYLMNYAVNLLVLPILVRYAHLDPIIAQVGFTVILTIGSYIWHSRITFQKARYSHE